MPAELTVCTGDRFATPQECRLDLAQGLAKEILGSNRFMLALERFIFSEAARYFWTAPDGDTILL